MPLYEYQCEGCGAVFEVMQKFADEPLKVHEACGGHVHRLLSAPALQFKGSGWYITDYGKGNGKPPSHTNSSDSAKSESKPAASTDSSSTSSSSAGTPAAPAKKD